MHLNWKLLIGGIFTVGLVGLIVGPSSRSQEPADGKTHIRYWQITGQKDVESYPVRAFNDLQDQIVIEATSIP